MKQLLEDIKRAGLYNEKESTEKVIQVGNMEDTIALVKTLGDYFDLFGGSSDHRELALVQDFFKQGKKIIHYDRWCKFFKPRPVDEAVLRFLERHPDFVLALSLSDSGTIIIHDTAFHYSHGVCFPEKANAKQTLKQLAEENESMFDAVESQEALKKY